MGPRGRDSQYRPPPRHLRGFPDALPAKPKTPVQGGGGLRPRWKDSKGRIYEWDARHGTVEIYGKTGKRHLGDFDPASGRPAADKKAHRTVSGGKLDLIAPHARTAGTRTAPRMDNNCGGAGLARGFVLQGFDRETEELRLELHLKAVPIERLRALFDVGDDYAMANAYPLDQACARDLQDLVSERIDTAKYDFFLQRYA